MMPTYLIKTSIWQALWPIPVLSMVVVMILYPLIRKTEKVAATLSAVAAFGLLGAVTGILTGLSRDPAVGSVLPAILSLVGALTLYILGLKKGDALLVSVCVISLTLNLLISIFWGADLRQVATYHEQILSQDLNASGPSAEALMNKADTESLVMEYRKSLRLP